MDSNNGAPGKGIWKRWDILFFAVAAVAMLVLAGWSLFAQG